jgi:hypothetical protein
VGGYYAQRGARHDVSRVLGVTAKARGPRDVGIALASSPNPRREVWPERQRTLAAKCSQTATVSWLNSMNVDIGVMTASGADQTTPLVGSASRIGQHAKELARTRLGGPFAAVGSQHRLEHLPRWRRSRR